MRQRLHFFRHTILTAACVCAATMAHAASCNGPQALTAALRQHPTEKSALALGNWFAVHQQFSCAADAFRQGLKVAPKSAQLHYLTGVALLSGGHDADAIPEIQQATQLDATVLKPHMMLAHLYGEFGRLKEAEEQWKKALAIDPKSETALEGLAEELLDRKDYISVVQLLQPAPRTEKLSIDLAKAFGNMNYLDEAAQALVQALENKPASIPLSQALSVVLIKLTRTQDAITLLQHTADLNPNNQEALLNLFRALVLTDHYTQARTIGPKLLEAHPHDVQVLYLNGVVNRATGNYALAKTQLQEAVALAPEYWDARYNLGMVLDFLHEWKEAREQLEKALSMSDELAELHFELAKALRGLGETDAARAEMQKYQTRKKDEELANQAVTVTAQGDKDVESGKWTEAAAHYREAIDLYPKSAQIHFKLAQVLEHNGDAENERKELEEAVRLDAKLAGAQNLLGYVLGQSGDNDGAIEHYRLATQAAPGWTMAWINLAASLASGQQYAAARDALNNALKVEPNNPQAKEFADQLAHDPAAQKALAAKP